MLAYLNGEWIAPEALTLSYADAGFVFGATITDYCRTYHHKLFRHADHATRFLSDCASIGITLPYGPAELREIVERLIASNSTPSEDLAVISFATPGLLPSYTGHANPLPTFGMHTVTIPHERYAKYARDGVALNIIGDIGTPGIVPRSIKHRSRLAWYLAGPATDVVPVLIDAHGIGDTAIGSILAVRGDVVLRPPRGTVLESVSLNVVEELCAEHGIPFREAAFDLRTWSSTSGELLLAGSGFGLARVTRLGDIPMSPGRLSRELVDHFTALTR
jgi:branched-subunit amino acid aminotransferase/4-amino-4-deoxychorismate lyase